MNITERHEFIIKSIKEKAKVSIDWLCKSMEVSSVTIRKDLKILEEKNLLFRVKGGASNNNPYAIDRPILVRATIHQEEKQRIALAAVKLIHNSSTIMIGSGTTAFALAKNLESNQPVTVITPSLKVSLELSLKNNIEVIQLSGIVRPNSSSITGISAIKFLEEISAGLLFIGADGIDLEFGISSSNLAEAILIQKMIASAQKTILMVDSSKFGIKGLGKICKTEDLDYIITDNRLDPETVSAIEDLGVKIMVV